jgi:hypothetical protein
LWLWVTIGKAPSTDPEKPLGSILLQFLSAVLWGMGYTLKNEMDPGVLEKNWVAPLSRPVACSGQEREERGTVLAPVDRPYRERALDTVQDALSRDALAEAWAQGQGLDLNEGIAFALGGEAHSDPHTGAEQER